MDDLISRKEAVTLPVMPVQYRHYQTMNLDDETYQHRNLKVELEYAGTFIRHRKNITNLDLRFYAWLFRAALKRINELEESK